MSSRRATCDDTPASAAPIPAPDTLNGMLHELSQPLTAIVAYATGCLLGIRAATFDRAAHEQALERVVAEALRAGELVRRLRASPL